MRHDNARDVTETQGMLSSVVIVCGKFLFRKKNVLFLKSFCATMLVSIRDIDFRLKSSFTHNVPIKVAGSK